MSSKSYLFILFYFSFKKRIPSLDESIKKLMFQLLPWKIIITDNDPNENKENNNNKKNQYKKCKPYRITECKII